MTLRRSILAALIVLCAISRPAAPRAQSGDILPFKATERTLANGLKVIVVPTGFPNLISIQIPVQTGSRNEVEPGKSGFAHFFEHLMFRGTATTPPDTFREIMSKAGSRDNAGTGDDRTIYYTTFAKDHFERVLGTYADMFQHLEYGEAEFKTEARAVLGEYNKNSAEPLRKFFEVQRETFFQKHTYKHTTMGFIADIEDMPNQYQYSRTFFERWYHPGNTTLIVAGDVTPEQVMPIVEKQWGGWKAGTAAPPPIPQETTPAGPFNAHVAWPTDTPPYVSVAFLGPAFSETTKDTAAFEMLDALYFGSTSDLYKKLVVTEQKVDQLITDTPTSVDPSLYTVLARVKKPADAMYVRDQILATFAAARATAPSAHKLSDAKSNSRYSMARTLDSTERIASVVSSFAGFHRDFQTANAYYRMLDSLLPADLPAIAQKYFTDNAMIITTLSKAALPAGIGTAPAHWKAGSGTTGRTDSTGTPGATGTTGTSATTDTGRSAAQGAIPASNVIVQASVLPQLNVKFSFTVGSAHDPAGKEGLAALTASMIADGGSRAMPIEAIDEALYPIAASFDARADKDMTTFTASVHKEKWDVFERTALPQLTDPGFRESDFARLRAAQLNALTQDLRNNNEEELGKEQLQVNLFRGTPYGHPALGTVAGLTAITLDDVKQFAKRMYTPANLTIGMNGDVSEAVRTRVLRAAATLPQGTAAAPAAIQGRQPQGLEVEILEKDTRATAISFGFPIDVRRGHADFPALYLARTWLGEHRASSGQLYRRIREIRGINYGDYAYIEAFPRGMFQFFPDPNIARRKQIFEVWIRPVVPENAHMTLRIALHELNSMVKNGLSKADFETTREYLMSNVFVMTARQDQQLGYALDSRFYGIGEYTDYMRNAIQGLTLDQVNAAIKKHLAPSGMAVVIITRDAAGLKQALASDVFSPIKYDGAKPPALLDEDKVIGAMKLNIPADKISITPIDQVFAR